MKDEKTLRVQNKVTRYAENLLVMECFGYGLSHRIRRRTDRRSIRRPSSFAPIYDAIIDAVMGIEQ
jgi:hypothetical protein